MLDSIDMMVKTVNGFKTKLERERVKKDGSIFGLMSAGPRDCDGIPERPSCKYPASTGAVPAMKPEATAIFAPQDGRWKITVSFDGRRFCVPKFRH